MQKPNTEWKTTNGTQLLHKLTPFFCIIAEGGSGVTRSDPIYWWRSISGTVSCRLNASMIFRARKIRVGQIWLCQNLCFWVSVIWDFGYQKDLSRLLYLTDSRIEFRKFIFWTSRFFLPYFRSASADRPFLLTPIGNLWRLHPSSPSRDPPPRHFLDFSRLQL